MDRVTATASCIKRLLSCGPSFLKHEHIHAPAHWCLTYSAKGQLETHSASLVLLRSTMQRPGGTNCGEPIFWRL